mmetsp:Transcript_25937/g.36728  ORF Transcript_25937/g.36728 Transcript_25937/m.36728 type:complete len:520 (+) Transcript_25937:1589-3148(+)
MRKFTDPSPRYVKFNGLSSTEQPRSILKRSQSHTPNTPVPSASTKAKLQSGRRSERNNNVQVAQTLTFIKEVANSTQNKFRKYTYIGDVNLDVSSLSDLSEVFAQKRDTQNFNFAVPSTSTSSMYMCSVGRDNFCSCRGWTFASYPRKTCVHLKDIYSTIGQTGQCTVVPLTSSFSMPTTAERKHLSFSCVGRSLPVHQLHSGILQGRFKIRTKIDGIRVAVFPNGFVFSRGLFLHHLTMEVRRVFAKEIRAGTLPPLDCELYLRNCARSSHDMVMRQVINRSRTGFNCGTVSLAVLDLFVPALHAEQPADFSTFDTTFTDRALKILPNQKLRDEISEKSPPSPLNTPSSNSESDPDHVVSPSNSNKNSDNVASETNDSKTTTATTNPSSPTDPQVTANSPVLASDSNFSPTSKPCRQWPFHQRFALLQKFFNSDDRTKLRSRNNKCLSVYLLDGETKFEQNCSTLSVKDIHVSFLRRMAQGQEGIVIQNMQSVYSGGKRDIMASFKVKKESDISELVV